MKTTGLALGLALLTIAGHGQEISLTDITRSAGVGGPTAPGRTGGHGAMFADVDGDGRPDLYITIIWEVPLHSSFSL